MSPNCSICGKFHTYLHVKLCDPCYEQLKQPPAAPTDIDGAIAEIDDALNFISLNPHGKLAMLRVRDHLTTESTPFIDDLRETINNTAHREMTRAEEVEYEQAIANAVLSEDAAPNTRNLSRAEGASVSHTPASAASSTVATPHARGQVEERDGKAADTFANVVMICPECKKRVEATFYHEKRETAEPSVDRGLTEFIGMIDDSEPAGVILYCPACNQPVKSNHECKEPEKPRCTCGHTRSFHVSFLSNKTECGHVGCACKKFKKERDEE